MQAQHFIDQLRVLAGLEDAPATDRVLAAFQSVPRERFAGPGPWRLRSALAGTSLDVWQTPDADPRWLYHSVLVVLDEEKGINIGDPGLWARLLARTDIQPGARVLQVGAGVGYYTAILSALTGPTGHVVAYEVEDTLAVRAQENLTSWPNVDIRSGSAVSELSEDDVFDVVVAFAGVTHIPPLWHPHLASDARLLLPLTGEDWWGAMVLAHCTQDGFAAETLGRCGFYPCTGARQDALAAQITALFADPNRLNGWRLQLPHAGNGMRLAAL
ncbi:MAG: methyltransferase domain-containing protein [Pseudomonadota bacterium]